MTMQQYCLRWNNHQPNFISVFSSLLNSESLVDVTLSAEGRHLQAHKLVLSACSTYFQSLFTINPCQHPIVILKDVKFTDLKVIIDFMYYGEVNVSQDQLPYILKTAEMLKIKGLAEIPVEASVNKQNSNTERTELLTPSDSNWSNSENQQRLSPSPCSLSPGSRRKRLRKSSTGSGSGSLERTLDEPLSNDVTLTSPLGTAVIKPDPGGFSSDGSGVLRKQELDHGRGSSQDNMDGETPHQITVQIPQHDISVQHNVDSGQSIEVAGPSATTTQTVAGYQWGIVDHNYPHFTQTTLTLPQELQYTNASINHNYPICPNISPLDTKPPPQMLPSPPAQTVQKRKRSVNPQADENFVRALEAVRFGGIGFCKAARMYGVNNRTLWLEYKKRGYPISRLSIKNRKPDVSTLQTQEVESPSTPETREEATQQQQQHNIDNSPIAMISSTFIDGRTVEISAPVLQRSRYFDNGLVHTTQINSLQGINFDQM